MNREKDFYIKFLLSSPKCGFPGNSGGEGAEGHATETVGPRGDRGDTGEKGDAGFKGDAGKPGEKGSYGDIGYKGEKGLPGQPGPRVSSNRQFKMNRLFIKYGLQMPSRYVNTWNDVLYSAGS